MDWNSTLRREFQSNVFDLQQVSLRPLHCVIKCFDCDRWKSQTMYISSLASSCSVVLKNHSLFCTHAQQIRLSFAFDLFTCMCNYQFNASLYKCNLFKFCTRAAFMFFKYFFLYFTVLSITCLSLYTSIQLQLTNANC